MKHARALIWLCITVALGAATWCAADRYPGFSGLACVLCVIAMFRTADEFRAARRSNNTDFIRPKGH